jgi:RHH-type rel operon transcriptional repressor/antitoxin RelB
MAISIRLKEQDEKLFKSYAKTNNMSLSELFRSAVFEKIEDEYDLAIYREALEEYNNNPISYSHKEVCKILGIE